MLTIPPYIEIKTATGKPVAYLSPKSDGLKECWLDNQLNGICQLSFLLPMASPKWQYLTDAHRIYAGGREFVITKPDAIEVTRDGEKIWGKVMAQESWIELGARYVTISNDPQNQDPTWATVSILSGGPAAGGYPAGSAGSALTYLLQGSGWSVGPADVTGARDLETERETLLANINKVQELWGGYLVWDSLNKTVSLRSETSWQHYTGFQIRYAKNLKTIARTVDYDLVTRLYPFGSDDLTIASVNDGVMYLDNNQHSTEIREGIYTASDIDDPQQLKEKAIEVLDRMSRPRYNYRVSMVDLRTLPEYQHEDFQIGDMVDIIDEGLGINVRARVIRHRYDVFQPWKCELEVGDPIESLAAMIAETRSAAKFVKNALKPNKSVGNLMKGFIDTFATQINGAKGKLVWNDDTFEAIEVDEAGEPTGNRVRITPGGIGISSDGGQTFQTAMTGAGILANAIIVNQLYAIATEDGYTKLTGSGLEVYDNQATPVKRVHAGQYAPGKFGLELRDKTGGVTILDEDGIMQTWQSSGWDNVDASNPLTFDIHLPDETKSVHKALLRLRLKEFRAFSKAAASGGGSTTTSSAGGSINTTVTSASGAGSTETTDVQIMKPGLSQDYTEGAGGHGHTIGSAGTHSHVTDTQGSHVHTLSAHNHVDSLGGATGYNKDGIDNAGGHYHTAQSTGSHQHAIDSASNHTHRLYNHGHQIVIPSHTHDVTVQVPAHQHSVEVPNHGHGLEYGIFKGLRATSVTIKINGVDRTVQLGGPFSTDQAAINIKPYLVVGQFNTIELGAPGPGRIDYTYFVQVKAGV